MKKWYMQIIIGVIALIAITVLNETIYPTGLFPSKADILSSGDPSAFYVLAILSLVAEALILIGLVRGIWRLIGKFRNFVRIEK